MSDVSSIISSSSKGGSGNSTQVEGVEKIEAQTSRRIIVLTIQLLAVALFIGGMVGGFAYAIVNGDKKSSEKEEITEPPPYNFSLVNYTVMFSQYSESGNYIVTLKPTKDNQNPTQQSDSYWYQDHDKFLIRHKFNETIEVVATFNKTYWIMLDSYGHANACKVDDTAGYLGYLERLGLAQMEDRHSEVRLIKGSQETAVYDGDPDAVQNPMISDPPFFVQGYVSLDTGVLVGWDTYYGQQAASNILQTEYWFTNMKRGSPPDGIDIPAICK